MPTRTAARASRPHGGDDRAVARMSHYSPSRMGTAVWARAFPCEAYGYTATSRQLASLVLEM